MPDKLFASNLTFAGSLVCTKSTISQCPPRYSRASGRRVKRDKLKSTIYYAAAGLSFTANGKLAGSFFRCKWQDRVSCHCTVPSGKAAWSLLLVWAFAIFSLKRIVFRCTAWSNGDAENKVAENKFKWTLPPSLFFYSFYVGALFYQINSSLVRFSFSIECILISRNFTDTLDLLPRQEAYKHIALTKYSIMQTYTGCLDLDVWSFVYSWNR